MYGLSIGNQGSWEGNSRFLYNLLKYVLLREKILEFIEEWHVVFMEQVNLFKNMVKSCEEILESDTGVSSWKWSFFFILAIPRKEERPDPICWTLLHFHPDKQTVKPDNLIFRKIPQ